MNLKQTLTAIVLSCSVMYGCAAPKLAPKPKDAWLIGTVVEEYGRLPGLLESNGALMGNETVKLGDINYTLKIKAYERTYIAQIYERGNRPLGALSIAIEKGTKIKFLKRGYYDNGLIEPYWLYVDNFGSDGIGTLWSTEIEILEKTKE